MKGMLSKSRLNRRLHSIEPHLWQALCSPCWPGSSRIEAPTGFTWWTPCRSRTEGESFRGYVPSKRRYFYGLRVHLVVSGRGEPVEFALAAGSESDITVFKRMNPELPAGATIHADKGYTDYDHEDFLEEVGLELKAQRKKNSKRPMAAWEEFLGKPVRQRIEAVFGELSALFSRKIQAVTPRGFELKIVWFLLAFSIRCL